MALTGTPGPTLLAKITSEEVLLHCCMRLTLWNEELVVHLVTALARCSLLLHME